MGIDIIAGKTGHYLYPDPRLFYPILYLGDAICDVADFTKHDVQALSGVHSSH